MEEPLSKQRTSSPLLVHSNTLAVKNIAIIIGIAAAIFATAISCKKADLTIGGDFAEKHYEISPGQTLVIPFTLSNMLGTGLEATEVSCSREDFTVGYRYIAGTGIRGEVTVTAPQQTDAPQQSGSDDTQSEENNLTVTLTIISKDGRKAQVDNIITIL